MSDTSFGSDPTTFGSVFNENSFIDSVIHHQISEDLGKPNGISLVSSISILSSSKEFAVKYMIDVFHHVIEDYSCSLGIIPKNKKWSKACMVLIRETGDNAILDVVIHGTKDFIAKIKSDLSQQISLVGSTISWIYNQHMSTIRIPLDTSRLPIDEMYPFIKKPLAQYYKEFYNSSANVLICIGEPGTGKTTFMRGMLNTLGISATLTYEQKLFDSDSFFANFMTSESNVMVIEDADVLLTPRSDGNSSMQRFLNAGDGLVSSPSRKLVFTTNLPNIKNIDPALIRSGRCFDVLHFRKLNPEEIVNLTKAVNSDVVFADNQPHTLAEVMTKISKKD